MGHRMKMYVDIMACHSNVTGSGFLCVVRLPNTEEHIRFLVDFGLFQGESEGDNQKSKDFEDVNMRLNSELLFDAEKLSAVLVTHNHIDHVGRLPMLVHNGYPGKIYSSEVTKKLLPIALFDSESIQRGKYKMAHKKPIYTAHDVNETLSRVIGCEFNKKIKLHENIEATFIENAHIPGASMILIEISFPGEETISLLFTGDYSKNNDFFDVSEIPQEIRDMRISSIIVESTYGATCTKNVEYGKFKKILLDELEYKKNIFLPVLSQQRAQQILYELKKLQDNGDLSEDIQIYLDGKLTQKYTTMYLSEDFVKEDMRKFLPKNLIWVYKDTREDVFQNNKQKIVVASSGMGSHGTSKRYISEFVSKYNSTIIFNCFLASGTVGRKLIETPKGEKVEIYGLIKERNCDIYSTEEFSSHAKKDEIIALLQEFSNLRAVIINHGDKEIKEKFAKRVYDVIDCRSVGIIDRDYVFRIGPWGVSKTIPTKFTN